MNTQKKILQLLLTCSLISAPLIAAPPVVQEAPCAKVPSSFQGAWENIGGGSQVLFQNDEIVIRKNGSLSVAKILTREPCRLLVRYQGLRSTWAIRSVDATVYFEADEHLKLRKLSTIPPELNIDLPTLPKPGPVPSAEAKDVEEELLRRARNDQDALKDPALKAKRPEIIADNLRYLHSLTSKVGWIDIPRFGKSAASAAILLAKHGSDLLLMKAALPIVERDVKEHGGSGEMFSVLYDELQITLGQQQKYGTQIGADAEGRPYILPLNDPTKVDTYRKEIGILSFKDYLKLASDNMGGIPLRVAGSDE